MPVLDQFSYDNLFAGIGVQPIVTQAVKVAINQTLVRGALFELNDKGEAVSPEGSPVDPEKVYGVMAETVVTDETNTQRSVAYMSGEFNERNIVVPEGVNLTDYVVPLRKLGIYLKQTVAE